MIPISTKTGLNMEELLHRIDSFLIKETNRVKAVFKVPTGSDEFQTILKNTHVAQVEVFQEDPNFSLIKAIVLDYQLKQYEKWVLVWMRWNIKEKQIDFCLPEVLDIISRV